MKSGKRSPRAHLELQRTAERFINIQEQWGPSLGACHRVHKRHRSPKVRTFENGHPNNTILAEDDARKTA